MAANLQTVPQQTSSAVVVEEEFNEKVKFFAEYLDENQTVRMKDRIVQMLQRRETRLVVDLNDFREYSREYWTGLINAPSEYLPAFERALKKVVQSVHDPRYGELNEDELAIGLEGALPQCEVNPRTLLAHFLGKTVLIEGIVTRCSLVRPKVRKSVHYEPKEKAFWMREYQDATMLGNEMPTSSAYPTEDPNGNPLKTEFGFCKYVDYQTIAIQEMPEKAPTGQLPRSVDVILNGDLVDRVKPGDRVKIYGVYRSLGGVNTGSTNAIFRTVVLANNVHSLSKSIVQNSVSEADIQTIKRIGKRKNVVELLSKSLAPSIYGSDLIKKAVLLQLLGGIEKNLSNGTHIRGDINILMVGDPSTAKSQMLRFVLKMAPLAIATTGRGSSGVGLTAAVTSDKDTGERRLEAGAMVLADRGIVCIDEFDKMSDIDRVAIHEVMEQQTVTIAKAGIHTSLNARCSVIAAANPKYGQYDSRISPAENTALPDSLMSRFDLVFIVLDQINPALDRILATHVLNIHRYTPPGLEEGEPIDELMAGMNLNSNDTEAVDDESPFEKHHPTLQGAARSGSNAANQILKVSFLKKYIHYAKSRVRPEITEEASEVISEKYAEFREKAKALSEDRRGKVFPVTPRTLEALIRLATAHAKARLSSRVEKKDAEAAAELLNYSIFREVKKPGEESRKQKKARTHKRVDSDASDSGSGSEDGESAPSDNESGDEIMPRNRRSAANTPARGSARKPAPSRTQDSDLVAESSNAALRRRSLVASQSSSGALSQLLDDDSASTAQASSQASEPAITLSAARLNEFRAVLNDIRMEHCVDSSSLSLDVLDRELRARGLTFSRGEVDAAISQMQDANQIMVAEDQLYFMG